jgi:phosphatidylglycerophosphate synthase
VTTPATSTSTAAGWQLPAPPLRNRALGGAALAAVAVTVLALWLQARLQTDPAQPLVALAAFASMITVALMAMRDHHPFPRLGPANQITMIRAGIVAIAASLIAEPAGASVAWVLVIATAVMAALDGVDGWLARRTGLSSAFGARFDLETDALFMLVLSVLVWRHDKAGVWVLAIGLMRYAFVASGWLLPWLSQPLRATRRGKAVAVAQVVGLGVALLPVVPAPASRLGCAVLLGALAWSFAVDVRFLYEKRARPQGRAL